MTTVSVDDDFARFGAKSYAINKINSVEVRESRPHGKGGAILCGIVALLALLTALGSLGGEGHGWAGWLVVGLVFAGLAYGLWQRAATREYQLFLMTSSSETQAFVTSNADEVVTLRGQIESAMLRHSRAGTDR